MKNGNIPTKIAKYEVYKDGTKLIGRGEEMALPSFDTPTNTVSGAGILGEFEDPTPGYFNEQELAIPFRVMDDEASSLASMLKAHHLEIRGGIQTNTDEGDIEFVPIRVVVRGITKKCDPGKLKAANPMETTITLSIRYILIEVDGEPQIELNKIRGKYAVNGVDELAALEAMC